MLIIGSLTGPSDNRIVSSHVHVSRVFHIILFFIIDISGFLFLLLLFHFRFEVGFMIGVCIGNILLWGSRAVSKGNVI